MLALLEAEGFQFGLLLPLLAHDDRSVRLRTLETLALFCFGNTQQQYKLRTAGGVHYHVRSTCILLLISILISAAY